jgi:hypothetical protein
MGAKKMGHRNTKHASPNRIRALRTPLGSRGYLWPRHSTGSHWSGVAGWDGPDSSPARLKTAAPEKPGMPVRTAPQTGHRLSCAEGGLWGGGGYIQALLGSRYRCTAIPHRRQNNFPPKNRNSLGGQPKPKQSWGPNERGEGPLQVHKGSKKVWVPQAAHHNPPGKFGNGGGGVIEGTPPF